MRYLSVCSGVEAATVAWHELGWTAVAYSEIEKFPSAVLAYHYPDVPNLGDFTKIDARTLPVVDILCGGTPCQAFSIAGLRQSLDDARGNLSLEFVRLTHELVEHNQLKNVVWENVPGVLSTKDNAFGCFLGGLVGASDPVLPPRGTKWPDAGMVSGPKGRAAWRVLDAQYFGLAQRRKRVILVADFGNGADPATVLFEPEGVHGNTPPSREARKDIAPTISARTKGGGGLGTDFDLDGGLIEADSYATQAGALRTNPLSGPDGVGVQERIAYTLEARAEVQAVYAPELARCVATREGSSQDYETTTMMAVSVTGSISHTLKAEGADASEDGTGRGTPIVCMDVVGTMKAMQGSGGWSNSIDHAAGGYMVPMAQTVALRGRDGGATAELGGEIATALRASQGGGGDKPHVLTSAVRRLTPTECERLQGFPDSYTNIPWRGKPTSPDGPRYKALGNSWAVPKFRWLGERIEATLKPKEPKAVSFVFQDFETQSLADLTITGGLKYCLDTSTRALLWSWGLDDDPIKLWCPDLSAELVPEVWLAVKGHMAAIGECPAEVVEALKKPDTYILGWNENFDRQVWQQVVTPDHGWPDIAIEQTLDVMSQAAASNLPGKLDMAGRALNLGQKTVGGSAVMKRFADRNQPLPGSPADIANGMAKGLSREKAIAGAIEMWDIYCTYAIQDTDLMRDIWRVTRPLSLEEWVDYWTSEHINDRGIMIDTDVCKGAVQYREEEATFVAAECARITGGVITAPTLTKQINEWVFDRLPDDLAESMVKARDDDGYVTRLTGDKNVMTRLIDDIKVSDAPPADDVVDLLELLQFGRSSSAVKFEKMLNQQVDERVFGQFVYNGAGQSGRFSSRGIQLHNAPRASVPNELEVLDKVASQVPIEEIRAVGPVSLVLARLIRPTIVAPPKRRLVWGDWSAIESRMVAWLADSRGATQLVLEPYAADEDLYILNAADIYHVPTDRLYEAYRNGDPAAKDMRQAGKLATLSLGYLGGVGALKAMARGYGLRFTNEEAQQIVDGWRGRNKWARQFGDKVERAMFDAMKTPLTTFKAGRCSYCFYPDLMGGALVAMLPDGRPLMYPKARIEQKEKFGQMRDTITYLNGMGRSHMWSGLGVENLTQGIAASLLRATLVKLEAEETEAETIGHVHDEVICEIDEDKAEAFADRLHAAMVGGYDWTEGLPLAAEVEHDWYYHK